MAPRGRPRKKVGQTRMDAAIDALVPLGFSKSDIRRKVNELLQVYDGEWVFFEEASYQGLIEALIADQDEERKKNSNTKMDEDSAFDGAEASCAGGAAEPSDAPGDTEPSGAHGEAEPSGAHGEAEPSGANPPFTGTTSEAPFTATTTEVVASTRTEHGTGENVNERGGVTQPGWKDISCMDVGTTQDLVVGTANNEGVVDDETGSIVENVSRDVLGLKPLHRRKPCYGWIGSDNDEEDCVFFPTEASQRLEMKRNMAAQKDRKCRWDVMQKS